MTYDGDDSISLELDYPPAGGPLAVMTLHYGGRVVLSIEEFSDSDIFSSLLRFCVVTHNIN